MQELPAEFSHSRCLEGYRVQIFSFRETCDRELHFNEHVSILSAHDEIDLNRVILKKPEMADMITLSKH